MNLSKFIDRYRVENGKKFRLKDIDPADTHGLKSKGKKEAVEMLQQGVQELSELQEKLYAQDRWALLLIFQAMDAAGKDGTINHVMSGVNPQGCQVYSFKASFTGGAGSRFSLAHHSLPSRTRPHRHLQPVLLRGSPDRARAPGNSQQPKAPLIAGHEEDLETTL